MKERKREGGGSAGEKAREHREKEREDRQIKIERTEKKRERK